MALISEKGTGEGSHLGNVTVRSWITLALVGTFCLCALVDVSIQAFQVLMGDGAKLQIDSGLANLVGVAVGYYLGNKPTPKTDDKQTP